ncbi:MAG: hypothetical protein ACYS76_09180 [Planctomycetota bacterium]|jgi:hypothetical protein
MKSIERRIEKIEQKLGVGRAKATGFRIVLLPPHFPSWMEPVEEWVTYKGELARQQPQPMIFYADPWAELQARGSPAADLDRLRKEREYLKTGVAK